MGKYRISVDTARGKDFSTEVQYRKGRVVGVRELRSGYYPLYPAEKVFCQEALKRKMLFGSERAAGEWLSANADTYPPFTRPRRAYFCLSCNGWHVTHLGR